LLQANAYYREWNLKFGVQGGRQEDIMQQERRRWSIVSKSPRGMYLLDADLKAEMRREGVVPVSNNRNLCFQLFCFFTDLFLSPPPSLLTLRTPGFGPLA